MTAIQDKAALLSSHLERAGNHYRRLAKYTHRFNLAIMTLTVVTSLVAGIGGLAKIFRPELVGALALLPGLLAIFATTMKLQAKANQHYRRKDALQALRNAYCLNCQSPQRIRTLRIFHAHGAN